MGRVWRGGELSLMQASLPLLCVTLIHLNVGNPGREPILIRVGGARVFAWVDPVGISIGCYRAPLFLSAVPIARNNTIYMPFIGT